MSSLILATLTAQVKAFRAKARLGTLNHMLAVTIVSSKPDETMEMRDLVQELGLAQATVSRLCETLEGKKIGLLTVQRSGLDTRQKNVSLTDDGALLAAQLKRIAEEQAETHLDKTVVNGKLRNTEEVHRERYGFALSDLEHRKRFHPYQHHFISSALKRLTPLERVELIGRLNLDSGQNFTQSTIDFLNKEAAEGTKIIEALKKLGIYPNTAAMEKRRATQDAAAKASNPSEVEMMKIEVAKMKAEMQAEMKAEMQSMIVQLTGLQATGNAGKVTVETDNTVSVEGYLNVPSGTTLNVPDGHTLNIETPKK